MKQSQTTPTPQKDRRRIPSPSALWRMWMDNLKEWRFYLEENRHTPVDIAGWFGKIRKQLRSFMTSLRRDMHHQANASRHRKFPESESGLAQLCLYAAGSVPRLASDLKERFTLRRRKQIDAAHAFQKQLDKIKRHPVAFLSGALVVVALCALLSLYTIGTTAVYDGKEVGTVSGLRTVNSVVNDLQSITRQTLGDESYTVDQDKLDTSVSVVSRQSVESREEFTESLSDELGMVEYAYVLYIDGEPVAATTFPNALDEMLDPAMPVGDQIAEAVQAHGKRLERAALERRVWELMELVGLDQPQQRWGQYPHQLSGGQRQRGLMAMALAGGPQILLADEPTTALDVTVQAQILDLLRDIQQKLHTSTILVSHDLGVVARAADRVAIMYAGRIVEIGTAEEIYYDPRHPYTQGLLRSLPALAKRRGALHTIPGMPPTLIAPPEGDAFARRNPQALAIDYRRQPPMFRVSDTHYAATWLLDPRAPHLSPPAEGDERHA